MVVSASAAHEYAGESLDNLCQIAPKFGFGVYSLPKGFAVAHNVTGEYIEERSPQRLFRAFMDYPTPLAYRSVW